MPAIMGGDARIQEKFQDAEYITQVEQMFREKFLENLGVSVYLFFHKYLCASAIQVYTIYQNNFTKYGI